MIGTVLQEPPPLTNGQYPGPTSSKTREHSIDVAHQRQGALWPRAGGAFFNYWIFSISIEITEGLKASALPMANSTNNEQQSCDAYLLFDFCSAYCTTDWFLKCFSHYWLTFEDLIARLIDFLDQGCNHCLPHLWDWAQDRHDSSKGAKCWRKYSFNQ